MGCGVLDKGYLKNELTYMPCEWQQVLLRSPGASAPVNLHSAAPSHSRAHYEGLVMIEGFITKPSQPSSEQENSAIKI